MITIYDANAYLRTALNRKGGWMTQMDPRLTFERALRSTTPEIWVWDGDNHNDRRRAIFPGYKIRDYTGQEDIFAGIELYRELLMYSRAIQIEVPTYEADDVCATLAKRFADQGQRVTIWTNDFDFHQLANLPGLIIKGMRPKEGVLPHLVPLYKALQGDSSDKIPGLPGFGPKSWTNLVGQQDYLNDLFLARDVVGIRAFEDWRPSHKAWLAEDENVAQLLSFYDIVRMIDVPMEAIDKGTYPGVGNMNEGYKLLARFGQ